MSSPFWVKKAGGTQYSPALILISNQSIDKKSAQNPYTQAFARIFCQLYDRKLVYITHLEMIDRSAFASDVVFGNENNVCNWQLFEIVPRIQKLYVHCA